MLERGNLPKIDVIKGDFLKYKRLMTGEEGQKSRKIATISVSFLGGLSLTYEFQKLYGYPRLAIEGLISWNLCLLVMFKNLCKKSWVLKVKNKYIIVVSSRVSQMDILSCQKFEKLYLKPRFPFLWSSLFENCQKFENQCISKGPPHPPKSIVLTYVARIPVNTVFA